MSKNILIVDPIFRGSRLFYSWLVAEGAVKKGYKPVIITRTHSRTDNYQELFGDNHLELHEVVNLPESFWYGALDEKAVCAIFDKIDDCLINQEVSLIYFSGINEIYYSLFQVIKSDETINFNKIPVVFTDYDATFLLRDIACNPPPGIIKRMRWSLGKRLRDKRKLDNYKYLKRQLSDVHIMLLDERINDRSLSRISNNSEDTFTFFPDPPPPYPITDAETETGKYSTPIKILLVGKQSRRKGILDVIRVANDIYPGNENLQFVISGKLEAEMEYLRPKLLELKNRIIWHDDYVSNANLLERYKQADYVMLPYTPDFNGSSGVMAMAAQCGKPVITTDHGLVGYRTKNNSIGFTYKSGDIDGLKKILADLPNLGQENYSQLSRNCTQFSRNNSIEKHQKIILGLLD